MASKKHVYNLLEISPRTNDADYHPIVFWCVVICCLFEVKRTYVSCVSTTYTTIIMNEGLDRQHHHQVSNISLVMVAKIECVVIAKAISYISYSG